MTAQPTAAERMAVAMCVASLHKAVAEIAHATTSMERLQMMRAAAQLADHLATIVKFAKLVQLITPETLHLALCLSAMRAEIERLLERRLRGDGACRRADKKKQDGLLDAILATGPEPGPVRRATSKAKASSAPKPYNKAARPLKHQHQRKPAPVEEHPYAEWNRQAEELTALFSRTSLDAAPPAPAPNVLVAGCADDLPDYEDDLPVPEPAPVPVVVDNGEKELEAVCEKLDAFHLPKTPSALVARTNHAAREPMFGGKPYARRPSKAKRV